MGKRAQSVTVFIILSLIFILAFSFGYYFLVGRNSGQDGAAILADQQLTQDTDYVKGLLQDCLEQETKEAKELYGIAQFSAPLIKQHIESYLPGCLDTDALESRGITIEKGQLEAKLPLITEDALIVELSYPITLTRGDRTSSLKNLNYHMALSSGAQLVFGPDGRTSSELRILSHDGRVELIIPAGTKIQDASGKPIDELSLRVADRNEGGLTNNVVIGMTVYEGQPDGAIFDPTITIRMRYNPDELLGLPEVDLKIGWYDEQKGFWWGLPSSDVDTLNKIVSANISHFTKIGTVGCTSPDADTIRFTYKNVITRAIKEDPTSLQTPKVCQNNAEGAPANLDAAGTTANGTLICAQQGTGAVSFASYFCYNGYWVKRACDQTGCDSATGKCNTFVTGEKALDTLAKAIVPAASPESAFTEGCNCSCDKNCRIFDGMKLAENGFAGSLGYVTFTIAPNGNGCVMAKANGEADIDVTVSGSSGDRFGSTSYFIGKIISESGASLQFDYLDGELKAGDNTAFFRMENLNGDDCVWAETSFSIKGKNITYPAQCDPASGSTTSAQSGTSSDCTVQDAINALCGKGDLVYNDAYPGVPNCEQDSKGNQIGFNDPAREPTLRLIIDVASGIDSATWRRMPLSIHPNQADILAKLGELNLKMICDSGASDYYLSNGYVCTSGTGEALGSGTADSSASVDPDASSSSKSCTAWEKSRTQDQLKAMIMAKAKELGSQAGIQDTDTLGKYLIALSDHETKLQHCTSGGGVITGDEGRSKGMFALYDPNNNNQPCNKYRMACNIDEGIKLFIKNYKTCQSQGSRVFDCRQYCTEIQSSGGTDIRGNSIASIDCSKEVETYSGFECALRYYQGWGCRYKYTDGRWTYLGLGVQGIHPQYLSIVADFRRMYPELSSGSTSSSGGQTSGTTGTTTSSVLTTSSIVCRAGTGASQGSCHDQQGALLSSVTECSANGGWPLYSTNDYDVTAGRKVCCRNVGCCCEGESCAASTKALCSAGNFFEGSCSEVKGCCVWDDSGCKKAVSTQSLCGGRQFFPFEENCQSHQSCETASLGSTETCHYCGSNAAIARQIDPAAKCSGRCCEAKCPPSTTLVPNTVYYNQCSLGQDKYCKAACGPTSLKMGLESAGYGSQNIAELWSGCRTSLDGTGYSLLNSYACSKNACLSSSVTVRPGQSFIENNINSGQPMIAIIRMKSYYPEGCYSGGGHFFLIVGYSPEYVIVNDPYTSPCAREVGEHLVITKSRFYSQVLPSHYGAVTTIKRA